METTLAEFCAQQNRALERLQEQQACEWFALPYRADTRYGHGPIQTVTPDVPLMRADVNGLSITLTGGARGDVDSCYPKAAKGFFKSLPKQPKPKRVAKLKAPAKSVSAAQAREIATVALSLIGMSFPRTPAEADAILEELSAGAIA